MLRNDKGKERAFDGVRLAAEPAVAVFAAIQIMRRKGNEPALRQRCGKIVVAAVVGIERIARHAIAAMLANYHRPALAGFEILGQHQNTPGK